MADLSKQLRAMKRILILLLALMPVIVSAQTKEEKKARRDSLKAMRIEQQRIADSTYHATIAQDKERRERERALKGCTVIISETIFDTPQEAFDLLVHNMMRFGLIPADINEKYYIVKTQPKMVGSATYDLTFVAYSDKGKVMLRASGNAYKGFSVGSGMFRSDTNMVVPIEYGGVEGSLFHEAWNEMEKYIKGVPNVGYEYFKE